MSAGKALAYGAGGLAVAEATGVTNFLGDDGGIQMEELQDLLAQLPDPGTTVLDSASSGGSGGIQAAFEALGEMSRQMQENTSLDGLDLPSASDYSPVPGPDDLRSMTDSAGESVGSSLGSAIGTALYQTIKTPSLALAEDLEPHLPYAEGDLGDTADAMWQDSATRALADTLEGPLPYAEGDAGDTKEAISNDVNSVTDGVNNVVNSVKETASGGVTGDSNTNAASETADRIKKTIDDGLTGDSSTNLAGQTADQMQQDVGTAIEEGFKIENPMTGGSIDDALNSAGLDTNYSWDGPSTDDVTNTVKSGGNWVSDRLKSFPL